MEELYAILAALQGGARYGFKIRVPHALVMTFLFKNELSPPQKIRAITILTIEHASKLAAFATIYKVCKHAYPCDVPTKSTLCCESSNWVRFVFRLGIGTWAGLTNSSDGCIDPC
jgi:hypothetical protein